MTEDIAPIGAVGSAGAADLETGGPSAASSTSGSTNSASTGAGGAGTAVKASAPAPASTAGGSQDLQGAVQQINRHLASTDRVMELHVDAASGVTVATIKDAQTGEVLQQVPSESVLELADMLSGWSPGERALLDLLA